MIGKGSHVTSPVDAPAEAHPYNAAHVGAEAAIRDLAHQAALIGSDHTEAAETLESARYVLHRLVDQAVDDEALRWPSPPRPIARIPRYLDLYAESGG